MRNSVIVMVILALSLASGPAQADQTPPAPNLPKIKVGDVAPDFTLLHYDGKGVKPVSLRDFRDKKNVVLAFFVFAFTGG